MLTKKDLEKNSLKELNAIADESNIKYSKSAKKDDLINKIVKDSKLKEETNKQKEMAKENISSQTAQQAFKKPVSFEDIPELPSVYGKNKMVFMVRDPYWGFVYWELQANVIEEHGLDKIEQILRVYDISESGDPENASLTFDVKINNVANNWYVKFPSSNRTFVIDLGYFKDGQFITVLRSNIATTPRDDVSDQIDEEWMLTDEQFKLILQASGADSMFEQIGSQELMKFLAGNVEKNLSSGGASISSPFGANFDK